MLGRIKALAALLGACMLLSAASPEEPVGWRGDGSGQYPSAEPPLTWSAEENVAWKTEMPGRSYGSPILVGDKLFVPSDPADLLCLSADGGKVLWRGNCSMEEFLGKEKAAELLARRESLEKQRDEVRKARGDLKKERPEAKEEIEALEARLSEFDQRIDELTAAHPFDSRRGAGNTAATPVSDGSRVYMAFGSGLVAAYTTGGRRLWLKFVEGSQLGFGHSSSPVLVDGKLIVHYQDLVALDAETGDEAWRREAKATHATPLVVRRGPRSLLLSPGGPLIRADDGEFMAADLTNMSEASPVRSGDVVYLHEGGEIRAVRLPEQPGEGAEREVLWEAKGSRGRRTPSAVLHDGLLFGVTTDGIMDVVDAETGEVAYRRRLDMKQVYSSVTSAGGHVFIFGTDGTAIVLKGGKEYDEVGRNSLEPIGSCPLFAGSRLYLRGHKHFYCIAR